MWRWVIKDYFSAFSWYKISARMKAANWFWAIYWIVITPAMSGVFEKWEYVLTFYLLMLPVGFFFVSSSLQRKKLPKIFYISPMEMPVRRAYIERKFLFSILIPAFVGGVSTVLLLVFQLCHPLTAGLYFFDILVISLFGGEFFTQTVEIPKDSAIQQETMQSMGITRGVAFILSFVGVFGMWIMLDCGPTIESRCKWIFFGIAVVLQLPLTIKGLTGWNGAVERALSYEVIKTKPRKIGGAS